MRRKDREMNKEFALKVIDKCCYSVLSVISPENKPYAVPLSMARIKNELYFHCAVTGKKLDALKYDPSACVVCVGNTKPVPKKFTLEYESAIIEGTAMQVTDISEKIIALKAIAMKYTPENIKKFNSAVEKSIGITDIWKISMDKITAKCRKTEE